MTVKNFDAEWAAPEEEREFVLRGHTFRRRATVRPEVLTRWFKMPVGIDIDEQLQIMDDAVCALIENGDGSHERYREIRASEENALSFANIGELLQWLVQEQMGRVPTQPDSSSTDGPETTGTPSTVDSSSPATRKARRR